MYEVGWSIKGEVPDMRPQKFTRYDEAFDFLCDEIDWLAESLPEELWYDIQRAEMILEDAEKGELLCLSIGQFAYWLLPLAS